MFWILPAITANFLWAFANVMDKYLVENESSNPYVYIIAIRIFGLAVLLLIPFLSVAIPTGSEMLWLILAGFLFFAGGFPYIRAMELEEVTRINIWWGFVPAFTFLIEAFLLSRDFSPSEVLGFMILMLGTVVASLHIGKRVIVYSKAVLLMILSAFIYSLYGIVGAHAVSLVGFETTFIWSTGWMIFFSFLTLLYLPFGRKVVKRLSTIRGKLFIIFLISSLAGYIGVLFNQWALSYKQAALVFALDGWQPVFVFGMVWLSSFFVPGKMKEDFGKKNIAVKFGAMVLMIVGLGVLSIS